MQRANEFPDPNSFAFQRIFEQSPIGMAITGLDGRILRVNGAACNFMACSEEEFKELTIYQITHPDDLAQVRELVGKMLRGELSYFQLEKRNLTRKGEAVWVKVTSMLIGDDAGSPMYMVSFIQDLTDERSRAADLETREARYRALFENTGAMVLTTGIEANITAVNNALASFCGYSREELVGQPVSLFIAPDQLEIARGMGIQKLREGGGTTVYDLEFLTKDGLRRPVQMTSNLIEEGGKPVGLQAIAIDMSEQRRAQEAIRRSEEHFRALVENARDLTLVLSARGEMLYVSFSANRLLGYELEDGLGKSVLEFIHPDDAADARGTIAGISKEPGGSAALECRIRHQDGSWSHFEILARNALDNPVVSGIIVNARDITERKRSEEAVRQSRAKLDTALASMRDAVIISDAQGNVVDFNDAFVTFNKFKTRQECVKAVADYPGGVGILDLFMPDGTLAPFEMWPAPRALRGETATNTEYTLRRKDTGETWEGSFSFGPIRDKDGRITGSVAAGRDITEHRRSEEALRAAEREKTLILDSASGIIAYHDTDHNLLWANKAYVDELGAPLDELKGKKCYQSWGLDRLCIDCPVTLAIQTGQPQEGELAPENQPHWPPDLGFWRVRSAPVKDSTGKVIGAIEVSYNITEHKQAEEALRRTQTELRALAARLISNDEEEHRTLARELHDDFSQRLAALGFDLAELEAAFPAGVPARLRTKMHEAQGSLISLSGDLRRLAHQMHPSALELLGLSPALHQLCKDASRQGHFSVRLKTRSAPKTLSPNASLCLYRVAQECLRNIVKHAAADEVSVTLSGKDACLRLSIRDNGVGFDTEAAPSRGGLGLVSVRERVRQTGGTLAVESRPGEGTQVTVEIPLLTRARRKRSSGINSPV